MLLRCTHVLLGKELRSWDRNSQFRHRKTWLAAIARDAPHIPLDTQMSPEGAMVAEYTAILSEMFQTRARDGFNCDHTPMPLTLRFCGAHFYFLFPHIGHLRNHNRRQVQGLTVAV